MVLYSVLSQMCQHVALREGQPMSRFGGVDGAPVCLSWHVRLRDSTRHPLPNEVRGMYRW